MKYLNKLIWIVFVGLIIGNVYVFVSGIKISDEINRFEADITKIHQENIDLEKETYEVESLQYTASVAARLEFTEQPAPLILNNTNYALNR